MTGWREVRLGDVAKFKYGKLPIKNSSSQGIYPIFTGYRYVGYCDNYNIDEQQLIIIARGVGGTGDVKITKEKCFLTNLSIAVDLIDLNIDVHYLYYYFLINNLRYLDSGSAQSQITVSDLNKLQIKLPPIKTQERIAGILSALDDKIELNNKINQNLEAQAQALFKSWFVDFEPFGRKIPDDWKYSSLINNDIFKLIKPGINFFENSKYYVATADANNTGIINNKNFITFDDRPSRANMQPTINSVWFAKMKNSQKHFVIDETWKDEVNKFILSTGFCGIQCSYNNLYYLWCFISSDDFNNQKDNLCNGTTMEAINNNSLATIQLLIPDFDNLNKFNSLVKPLFELISINKFQNQKLAEIRDALLPKLISGQIDVENFNLSV